MRPQVDLRPGRVVLALGALGFGSACVAGGAGAAAPDPPRSTGGVLQLAVLPGVSDRLGGALGPLAAPGAAAPGRSRLWASTPRRNLLVGRAVSVSGAVRPDPQHEVVALQERRGTGWATVARGLTGAAGRYRLGFRPPAPGTLTLRVRSAGDRVAAAATAALGVVNIYRVAGASWYGPGGPLACGGTLTDTKLGVAHRTLPCGTLVRLRLGNRTVQVPVIDRGPYVAGRDYDLTPATKRALGFGDTGDVWVTR